MSEISWNVKMTGERFIVSTRPSAKLEKVDARFVRASKLMA